MYCTMESQSPFFPVSGKNRSIHWRSDSELLARAAEIGSDSSSEPFIWIPFFLNCILKIIPFADKYGTKDYQQFFRLFWKTMRWRILLNSSPSMVNQYKTFFSRFLKMPHARHLRAILFSQESVELNYMPRMWVLGKSSPWNWCGSSWQQLIHFLRY